MITWRRYDYVAIGEIKRRRGRQIILEIVVEITLALYKLHGRRDIHGDEVQFPRYIAV